MNEVKYRAFISYSHKDRKWGAWLHRVLETYWVPKRLRSEGMPARLSPIFRDREELASSPDLGARIQNALRESSHLIVICSPYSSASRWVNEEILFFQKLGRADRILCLIVGGEPNASDPAIECFPPALREEESIAADARP